MHQLLQVSSQPLGGVVQHRLLCLSVACGFGRGGGGRREGSGQADRSGQPRKQPLSSKEQFVGLHSLCKDSLCARHACPPGPSSSAVLSCCTDRVAAWSSPASPGVCRADPRLLSTALVLSSSTCIKRACPAPTHSTSSPMTTSLRATRLQGRPRRGGQLAIAQLASCNAQHVDPMQAAWRNACSARKSMASKGVLGLLCRIACQKASAPAPCAALT